MFLRWVDVICVCAGFASWVGLLFVVWGLVVTRCLLVDCKFAIVVNSVGLAIFVCCFVVGLLVVIDSVKMVDFASCF